MSKVIEIANLSKVYDLGLVGTGTLYKDLNRMWAKLRGKQDPYATIVELNDRTKKSATDMVYALKDVNFSVKRGEVLGVIGKNGAGKSTLLKILSQITSPSTGTIKMSGTVASLLEVGTGMHPEMTARQNIYLNGSLMGMRRKKITSKLDEIVAFAGVEKYLDTPVKRYSSGMKVRLAFAVAAHLEPDVLIVDEVLAVGDAEFQKKAIGKMQNISNEEGRTVLFVSHNMAAVQDLCSRVIILENGMLTFDGNTDEGVSKYLNSEVISSGFEKFDLQSNLRAQITKFEIRNENNEITSRFNSGETMIFKVFIRAGSELRNSIISIRIADHNNINVVTWRSNDLVQEPIPKKINEDFVLELSSSELYLLNGVYNISMGFADGKEIIDMKMKFINFEVFASKPSTDYHTITKENSSKSIIFSPAIWKVRV
jgi:lipopolysaccharide transport system ATP-binding protein